MDETYNSTPAEEIIYDSRSDQFGWFCRGEWQWFGTLTDAKAAAFADYKQRIHSRTGRKPVSRILDAKRDMDRIHALEREKEELRKERDYWKTEALGDRQKVERRDRQLAERDADLARVRAEASEVGNMIHNLSCRHQHNEDLSEALGELRSRLWALARAAIAGSGDGWRLVPVETLEMLRGYILRSNNRWADGDIKTVNDLLYSAPDSPLTAGER